MFARIQTLLLLAILFVVSAPLPSQAQKVNNRPNVIVIYTDDQGSIDANCYGSKDLVTPTFDKLAATGIRFTQMYSPSAICSASRAGLLTGRFPPRAGVPGNVSSHPGKPGLPVEEITIAGHFGDMLQAIDCIGSELVWRGRTAAPPLRIAKMTVAGDSA